MDRDRLLIGLAAVFAGLTTLFVVLALAYQLFLFAVAVPFGVATYFLWYHASGRLEARTRTRARQRTAGERRANDASRGPGGFEGFGPGRRAASAGGTADGGRRTGGGRQRTVGPRPSNEPSEAEAYRTLGLDADATDDEVKRAYRNRVKEVHPDTDSGDEETFKRVNRAYERLSD
ncbi:J domain-containing protein [Halopelagius longus]|uniref:J domain-containing protein n=1 Tax=Halopelagius longus TaxID=1236180 RepID=A0A1H0YGD5_9EURY|nr:J domain-containing protein [Halopelagius longus]RDI72474.1 J domain-containing protein [Halopelagius longus]SDQ14212.1 DnaJ domain-containing protein [Halopelagius longus]